MLTYSTITLQILQKNLSMKCLVEHTIANTPLGGFGEVGRMGLSWLKKYLVNDSCYCPLLLDVPTTASDYQTNIDCSIINGNSDYNNDLMIYPNPANNTITLKGTLNKNK